MPNSSTDWSRYAKCERKWCWAPAGEACTNLAVRHTPGFDKRPLARRPHGGRQVAAATRPKPHEPLCVDKIGHPHDNECECWCHDDAEGGADRG